MFLVHLITVLIFFERHWDSGTRQMADALASEIKLLIEIILGMTEYLQQNKCSYHMYHQ